MAIMGAITIILVFIINGIIIFKVNKEWYPSDKKLCKYLITCSVVRIFINKEQGERFSIEGGTYIQKSRKHGYIGLISKWSISGIGPVPRWYKSHKLLNKMCKSIKQKNEDERYQHAFGTKLP